MIDWFKEWGLNGLGGLYAFELSLEPPQEEAPEYLGSQMKRKGCQTGCSWNCLMLVCRISPKNWSVFFSLEVFFLVPSVSTALAQ